MNPAPAVPLPDELFQDLGHLVVNESEAALLSGKAVNEVTPASDLNSVTLHFLDKGVKNVVITLGAAVGLSMLHGSIWLAHTIARVYFITPRLEKSMGYLENSWKPRK